MSLSAPNSPSTPSILIALFAYKTWANDEILSALRKLDEAIHKDDRHLAIRIMNHTYVVDQIFRAQLLRQPHDFAATNTPDTPTLAALTAAIAASDAWFVQYVRTLSATQLHESLKFKFTDGDAGTMTREEILHHLITHGSYHRGAAGRILANLSIAPPRDVFSGFLHKTEPARREAAAQPLQ
jgi:uncharacterized damage-inducible protein DinB